MFERIIQFSVRNKLIVVLLTLAIALLGVVSMNRIAVDAVPDITNNQVQVVTVSSTLAAQEVEQFITFPIEMSLANIPNVSEIRSISRFGLSVVTIVFNDDIPILDARQYVKEQLSTLGDAIPSSMGSPEMMPITTGLGEIYQYTLTVDPEFTSQYDAMELRTIQDWIVKRQLMGTPGIVDVSSFGGYLKQYEVAVDPIRINQYGLTISDVFQALEMNNQNSGGSYIEKNQKAYYIRTEGLVKSLDEIGDILIERKDNSMPVRIRQVAEVKFGSGTRFGAMTKDGLGEAVGGITLMLKGGNSSVAIQNVHDRIEKIQGSLPAGVHIEPFLDRSVLVGKTIKTVAMNLFEGGLIVIFVLILMLGNLRAGLIVASVIPLSMLFAFIMMDVFGVSANLMSLGAIDFGIVVDGAVIIIEAILHAILLNHVVSRSQQDFDQLIATTSAEIYKTAAFGVLIILVVFIPIMTLTGIEGKMFSPMAKTFSFAILGAFILTLTYVPMMSAVFLRKTKMNENSLSERFIRFLQRLYQPAISFALSKPKMVVSAAAALLVGTVLLFMTMGAVFIPTLEEGDLAMQMAVAPGSSLTHSINTATKAERILLDNFPEVKHVVSKIGTAEVPTDPMGIEDSDVMIVMKDKEEWTTTKDKDELMTLMKEKLSVIEGASFDFTQPIQLRFNELITGAKTDLAIKIFGEDMDKLRTLALQAEEVISGVEGAADVKVEQTSGLTQYLIRIDRSKCAQYGVDVERINQLIRTAYAGEKTGTVYEGERRFDLVVRLDEETREDFNLSRLYVHTPQMQHVPVSELAEQVEIQGPVQIQREDAKRRITVGVNVRNRDIESFVNEVEAGLNEKLDLPPGYFITYGGAFENLQSAKGRLLIAVPAALLMIIFLLYLAFSSIKEALLIFSAVPLSAAGGVLALWLRDMPFSISAGVGFIALFGVAVLNGIVMIGYFRTLMTSHSEWSLEHIIENGAITRLRPVIMTALVAMLGFLPMAISTSEGAEVQKPLATVVIGGLITSTLLTLVVLPAIYLLANRKRWLNYKSSIVTAILLLFLIPVSAQTIGSREAMQKVFSQNVEFLKAQNEVKSAEAELKGALDLGTTNVNGQFGQINAPYNKDYNLEIIQNLGNPIETASGRKVAQANIDLAEAQLEMTKRSIERDVAISWVNWAIDFERLQLLSEIGNEFDRYLAIAEQRKKAGEINILEYSAMLSYSIQFDLSYEQQLKAMLEKEQDFKFLTQLSGDIKPNLAELDTFQCTSPDQVQLSAVFATVMDQKREVNERMLNQRRAAYAPMLNVGYFNQQIEGVSGLQGFKAGVSIPLWAAPQKSLVALQQLDNELMLQTWNADLQKLESAMLAEQRSLVSLYSKVSELKTTAIAQGSALNTASQQAYEAGEIDYIEFLQLTRLSYEMIANFKQLRGQCYVSKQQLDYYIK